jgi:phenylpyruvate tautomerase PptA (4-oxalocrotonate tautomerase family)
MPLLDVTIPEGALTSEAEHDLLRKLMNLLLEHEGADPTRPAVQAMAWTFLHRPAVTLVGGIVPTEPRYWIGVTVPDGMLSQRRRDRLVENLTAAALDAQPPDRPRNANHVWVVINTVPDGSWGAGGQTVRLADIQARASQD